MGQIPGGNLRAYYRLENVNDSGANGYNLTNVGTVTFNPMKLSNGADYGASGTTKQLTYGSNMFSTTTPDNVFASFFMKFNSVADIGTVYPFVITSKTSAADGRQYYVYYSITAGVCTLGGGRRLAASDIATTVTFTPNTTERYYVTYGYNSAEARMAIRIYDSKMNLMQFSANTSAAPGGSSTGTPTIFFSLGNGRGGSVQVLAMIDEFILDESGIYCGNWNSINANRVRYRTMVRGLFY